MDAPVTLRPVQAGDFAAWWPLWQAYLAFYDTTLPETVARQTFARLSDPAEPDFQAFLAIAPDGAAVGLVNYLYHGHCWRPEGVCYLQDLFVAPQARGQGIARALIEAVYQAADAAGRPSVYWMTQEFNAPARVLYDKVGTWTPFIKYVRP